MTGNSRRGFTLVELLVAMAVFSVVIAVATGAFIRALRTQRQLAAFASANSNVSLVLEQMAREIRVGRNFTQANGEVLSFTNGRGEEVTYRYDQASESISRSVGATGATQPLTSDNVSVRDMQFFGSFIGDDDYPARITVTVQVSPKELGLETSVVRIQTTISVRNIGT